MPAGLGANQDRRDIRVVAPFVEIVKIECVVNNLIRVLHPKVAFADLELDYEDDSADDHNGVDATAHAWDDKFQVDRASVTRQGLLKDCGLF